MGEILERLKKKKYNDVLVRREKEEKMEGGKFSKAGDEGRI